MKTLQDPQKLERIGEFYSKIKEAHMEYFNFWLHHTLFHWDFFLSFILSVVPWVLWIKYRKKESTHRLLFAGVVVSGISALLDFWGSMYGLWYYSGKMIPTMPSYLPWDFCIIPVIVMLLLQYKPKTSPMLKALIFAGISSFVGEPLFLWIGLYIMTKWSIFYSFPIYFFIYLAAHGVSRAYKFAEL